MKLILILISLAAFSAPVYAGGYDGIISGVISGLISGSMQQRQKTVVVREQHTRVVNHTRVVHDPAVRTARPVVEKPVTSPVVVQQGQSAGGKVNE